MNREQWIGLIVLAAITLLAFGLLTLLGASAR